MAKPMNLPMIASGEGSLNRYLQDIRKFPMLTPEEEYMFGKAWKEHQDPKAAERMITSHLRLVAKIAMGYRGYGLPVGDVISEGNIGLMHAVKRYDPDKGFKLATYAMWWIKAQIQEFVLRSWSLVKIGTTSSQKKLFFNLRKMKSRIQALEEGDLRPENVKYIAKNLGVSETDVVSMNRRLMGDASLNAPLRSDADGDGEWQDWLVDDHDSPETVVGNNEEADQRNTMLTSALKSLTEREREVIEARKLRDEPATLEDLSQKFGVSRERIRQIEVRAFEKLQKAVKAAASKALAPKQKAILHAAG
jgi:RNA polymerase sigma-32 factor